MVAEWTGGRSLSMRNYIEASLVISATVISEDGSKFSAYDDTAMVSRNYVDFEFTAATRKYFKQRIPFQGEVRLPINHKSDYGMQQTRVNYDNCQQIAVTYMNGTPADNIEIELKTTLDRQPFATQKLVSQSGGIIQFSIPPFSDHIDTISLEVNYSTVGKLFSRSQYFQISGASISNRWADNQWIAVSFKVF